MPDTVDTVTLEDAGASMVQGSRTDQQDRFTMVLPDQFENKANDTLALFAVCDGHVTDIASSHAIQNLPRLVIHDSELANGNYEQVILSAIQAEDKLLYEQYSQGGDEYAMAGTTLVICLVDLTNGILFIGNLGDSRVLLGTMDQGVDVENIRVECVTGLHKPASPSETHRIEDAGGRIHTGSGTPRIGTLNISRSLGDLQYNEPLNKSDAPLSYAQQEATFDIQDCRGDFVSSEPTTSRVNLQDSELYVLVLATDGVTDMLSAEDVIRRVAISFWHSEGNADRASSIITAQSTALPESDNSTCVSVFLKGAKA